MYFAIIADVVELAYAVAACEGHDAYLDTHSVRIAELVRARVLRDLKHGKVERYASTIKYLLHIEDATTAAA